MALPMQASGIWMWSMAQTVGAMSLMPQRTLVSPCSMFQPRNTKGMWAS